MQRADRTGPDHRVGAAAGTEARHLYGANGGRAQAGAAGEPLRIELHALFEWRGGVHEQAGPVRGCAVLRVLLVTRDPELPNGYQDADFEMRELYAAGARSSRGDKAMRRLRAAGRLTEAAAACTHGGGWNTDGQHAERIGDPRAGEHGMRCDACGSYWAEAADLWAIRERRPSVACEWVRS